jgi:hypothetical protein
MKDAFPLDDFERMFLDGPAAIEEQIGNTWASATDQERERILGEVNASGILSRMKEKDMKTLINLIMKLN